MGGWIKLYFCCIRYRGQELQLPIASRSRETTPIQPTDKTILVIDSISCNLISHLGELRTCGFGENEPWRFEGSLSSNILDACSQVMLWPPRREVDFTQDAGGTPALPGLASRLRSWGMTMKTRGHLIVTPAEAGVQLIGVGRACCSPSLRTVQADLPHTALQSVVLPG